MKAIHFIMSLGLLLSTSSAFATGTIKGQCVLYNGWADGSGQVLKGVKSFELTEDQNSQLIYEKEGLRYFVSISIFGDGSEKFPTRYMLELTYEDTKRDIQVSAWRYLEPNSMNDITLSPPHRQLLMMCSQDKPAK